MKVRGTGSVLIGRNTDGEEVRSPPAAFIEIDGAEGRALVEMKLAVEVGGEPVGDATEGEPATQPDEGEGGGAAALDAELTTGEGDGSHDTSVGADDSAGDETAVEAQPEVPSEDAVDGETDTRAETIISALDLIEDGQKVKTGPRKGRPTVEAMEEITGLTDLTAEEIDGLAAKHEAEG